MVVTERGSTVYPVARRGDRHVLLARFETFVALQAADENLVEDAVALSRPRAPG